MTGLQAYILSKGLVTSVVTGIKSVKFNDDGDLEIETMNGTIIKRKFKDIKNIEFRDVPSEDGEDTEKHLFVIYSDNSSEDIGKVDASFDINQLITIGSSADEVNATTPLFINTDTISDDDLADSGDLDDIWNS